MYIKRLGKYALKYYPWLSMLEIGMDFIFLFLLNTFLHVLFLYNNFYYIFLITKVYEIKFIRIRHFLCLALESGHYNNENSNLKLCIFKSFAN